MNALRRWVTASYVRLLCTLLGQTLLDTLRETYRRGYADGRATEHAAAVRHFAWLERQTPPRLH